MARRISIYDNTLTSVHDKQIKIANICYKVQVAIEKCLNTNLIMVQPFPVPGMRL